MALSDPPFAWALLLLLIPGPARAWSQTAKAADATASTKPVRVRTDVESFHLDRRAGTAQNQVGAASRGGHTTLTLCAPNSGLASSARPVFVWQLPSASLGPVHFSLVNATGDVVFESEVAGTQFMYPEEGPALTPGDTFAWTVSGHGGTDKLPTYVQVEVQAKAERDQVMQQLAKTPADPLARAQVLLAHQVWYDAVAELQQGLRASPNRQDLKQQLHELYRQVAPACADQGPQ